MEIKKSEFIISSAKLAQCPKDDKMEFAFIGRSNVGKSSLINALCNHKNLAKTSATPGKTLLINHFRINDSWYIVDLPGYGFAKRSKKVQDQITEMINTYILNREQLVNVFLLIDIRHDPQKIDREFMTWLGENGVPFSIVFTKADKLGPVRAKQNAQKYMKALLDEWEELPPYFITSSEKKTGREEVLDYIDAILNETSPLTLSDGEGA
ncbi:MAG: ribosome biogenesis GTP-binding protein YihA/YsxC [Prevotella sp.]|nr:ribosome biogenesis GTP-binding protein YihA/YsxC [Prevotella sp.]